MPKAILAMRSYPLTMIVAIVLFIATLIITTGSLGKVHSNGDGGDGGSGMGGTGKSGDFGGSGFGGTGGPSPFFTSIETADEAQNPSTDSTAAPLTPAPLITAAQEPQPSVTTANPETLRERVMEAIDDNPLRIETDAAIAQGSRDEDSTPRPDQQVAPMQLVTRPEARPSVPAPAQSPVNTQKPAPAQQQIAEAESKPALAPLEQEPEELETTTQLAETHSVKMDTEQEEAEEARERNGLPERIQRPELPPFQRIRPIERPALLPPRVQPMRI